MEFAMQVHFTPTNKTLPTLQPVVIANSSFCFFSSLVFLGRCCRRSRWCFRCRRWWRCRCRFGFRCRDQMLFVGSLCPRRRYVVAGHPTRVEVKRTDRKAIFFGHKPSFYSAGSLKTMMNRGRPVHDRLNSAGCWAHERCVLSRLDERRAFWFVLVTVRFHTGLHKLRAYDELSFVGYRCVVHANGCHNASGTDHLLPFVQDSSAHHEGLHSAIQIVGSVTRWLVPPLMQWSPLGAVWGNGVSVRDTGIASSSSLNLVSHFIEKFKKKICFLKEVQTQNWIGVFSKIEEICVAFLRSSRLPLVQSTCSSSPWISWSRFVRLLVCACTVSKIFSIFRSPMFCMARLKSSLPTYTISWKFCRELERGWLGTCEAKTRHTFD